MFPPLSPLQWFQISQPGWGFGFRNVIPEGLRQRPSVGLLQATRVLLQYLQSGSPTHLLLEVGWENEPLKKPYFNFGGLQCKKDTLHDPSWAHIWNQRCMNFPKITLKTKFPSQMLSQSPKESLPPIWPRFWWHIVQLDFLIFSSTVFLGRFQTGLNSSVMITNWSRMV